MNFENILYKNKKVALFIKITIGLILALAVFLLIFRACSNDTDKTNADTPYGNYEVTDGRKKYEKKDNNSDDAGYIKFSGYGKYEVSAENPSIELSNPSSNDADFVFTVKDSETQQLIGKTEKVSPGKFVYMNVMDFYKTPGVYNVDINISTYDSVTDVQLNGVNQKMEITVK